ncbi:MAG: tRNA (adenosine(37)-N6)-threonylcarbamoyltransferase complex transferase subunit TsaD [Candidatus Omnitrophica bacterium]|nr:tRNA (adenosine(37)-N6)-threonylcarbamoyltransferase complex transferase subunit TsaD [Candidatus Omnitrophota bacterium]
MLVMGIETSCDETSVSVVKNGRTVLSNVVSSSLRFHKQYGGIVPEIAFRKQLETIAQVAESALREAGVDLKDIGLISVTDSPGLLGSLVVGISFAKAVSIGTGIPLLGVNHLHSHVFAGFLEEKKPRFPFTALIVSGGHSSLYYVRDFDRIRLMGSTKDDACGEAFDKVAKILQQGYPGGPVIERLSKKGNAGRTRFNCLNSKEPYNFSFSGIKTAVLYYVKKNARKTVLSGRDGFVCDVAASFQDAVIETLVVKSLTACKSKKTKRLVIGGGVAANGRLRTVLSREGAAKGIEVFFPSREYCMDNAAMVACLGYYLYKKGHTSDLKLDIHFN